MSAPEEAGDDAYDASLDEASFRLDVQLDSQREKVVMLRVVLMVEVCLGLLLVRQVLLQLWGG